ncbi:sulfite exporter TauE/SafE family protein [Shouchella sp. JSM 1781072]|uniref:sulfite exporter TauE/SafE family protein n=1 Tax=Bacillaceae TaxID=186817 RepID=UPI0020D0EB78|nr:sulfite exporter TauE/SafE family protein [Alkalihalobacillus sp. LMS6]UTR04788.1 sulfite exporter TauE/SafE family protein [Alkalihalobacillus sp. LMS6]
MALTEGIILILIGFIAGIINTVSAGGSLLTLPLLLFVGLPATEANATNRVAIVAQSITSIITFKQKQSLQLKRHAAIYIAAATGAAFGALSALSISDQVFILILALTMITSIVFLIWNPIQAVDQSVVLTPIISFIGLALFGFIGFYSGFIQVGVGFYIMILAILLYKKSFAEATLIKIMIVGISVSLSLVIYAVNGQVNWLVGIVLAIGNIGGAFLGSRMVLGKHTQWIRIVLIVTVLILAIRLMVEFFS